MGLTNTYGHGNELVSEGSDGMSLASADVCWTPPAPTAGPVSVPYSNSTEDKNLADGTTSVGINDKPACMEKKSKISKSTGDTGATKTQQMNMLTGVIEGEATFITGQQDLKVEGQNATANTDLTAHNQKGAVSGTAPGSEISGAAGGGDVKGADPEKEEEEPAKLVSVELLRIEGDEKKYYVATDDQCEENTNNESIIKFTPDSGVNIQYINITGTYSNKISDAMCKVIEEDGKYASPSMFSPVIVFRVRYDKKLNRVAHFKATLTKKCPQLSTGKSTVDVVYSSDECKINKRAVFALGTTTSNVSDTSISHVFMAEVESFCTEITITTDMSALAKYDLKVIESDFEGKALENAKEVSSVTVETRKFIWYNEYQENFGKKGQKKIDNISRQMLKVKQRFEEYGIIMLRSELYNDLEKGTINDLFDAIDYIYKKKDFRGSANQVANYNASMQSINEFETKVAAKHYGEVINNNENFMKLKNEMKANLEGKVYYDNNVIKEQLNKIFTSSKTPKEANSLCDFFDQCRSGLTPKKANSYTKDAIDLIDGEWLYCPKKIHLFFINALFQNKGQSKLYGGFAKDNIIAVEIKSKDSLFISLTHELGHWLGIVPCTRRSYASEGASPTLCMHVPCNPVLCTNTSINAKEIPLHNTYIIGPSSLYTGMEGVGPHCNSGATLQSNPMYDGYGKTIVLYKYANGECIMQSDPVSDVFCSECEKCIIKSCCGCDEGILKS